MIAHQRGALGLGGLRGDPGQRPRRRSDGQRAVAALGHHGGDQVALRDQPGELAVDPDPNRADLLLGHEPGRLPARNVGREGDDLPHHVLSDAGHEASSPRGVGVSLRPRRDGATNCEAPEGASFRGAGGGPDHVGGKVNDALARGERPCGALLTAHSWSGSRSGSRAGAGRLGRPAAGTAG